MPKFSPKKGFYGFECDDEKFLKPDNTDPFQASASGVGYQGERWDDDYSSRSEYGFSHSADDDAFLRPSDTVMDGGAVSDKHADLIDYSPGANAGEIMGGSGPLPKTKGIGKGPPRFAPKTGKRTLGRDSI
jgi:hypothetical protein